ncbi:MAG: aminomethyl transferase family protein [Anaerolineaceae bacterium]|nr:aminomethyl transferase family protein [Anaerolineaceae bacterium]
MPERRTPLYDYHLRSAGRLVKGGGDYMFPLAYTSPVEEHLNVRTNVGMQDLSSMGEVDIKGPGAERLISQLLVNDIRDMEPGQVRYSTMCNEDGGVVDDITVYKFHDEHFMIVTSSGPRQKSTRWIADHAIGTSTYVTDVGGAIALPVVQGPRSREFLRTVLQEADVDLNRLRFFRFTPARINDINLILSRSGYTGELGYELYTPAEDVGLLWDYLLQTGREFGLQPYGVGAMQSLRLEKALVLYGNDVNEHYTPFHVGLDRWIRFDKREFIGREALLRVQERGLDERWVGLVLDSPVPASYQDKLYSVGDMATFKAKLMSGSEAQSYRQSVTAGAEVGYITFSSRGHSVGQTLAMAYVAAQYSWPGCNLLVDINGRLTPAKVSPTPFFDPPGARLRAKAKDDGLQAQPQAVPKSPKAPSDTPPRPPEEDAPPADKSSEPPPNKPASSGKKKSGSNQEAD